MSVHRMFATIGITLFATLLAANANAGYGVSWGVSPNPVTAGQPVQITLASGGPLYGTPISWSVYANGTSLCTTAADYTGTPIWTCSGTVATAGSYTLTAIPSTTSTGYAKATYSTALTVSAAPVTGVLFPKYRVVALTYAPPGSKSTATYTDGYQSGTSTSVTTSTSNALTVTAKLGSGIDIAGFVDGSVTATVALGWTQEQDSSSGIAIAQTYSSGLTVPAPPLTSKGVDLGVDHDFDTVYVWLNPADGFSFIGNTPTYTGSFFDQRDGQTLEECNGQTYYGVTGMDVVPLTIGQLTGTQPITDPCLVERLTRPWDPAQGGLTETDFLAIANTDPFYANPSFNPNTDTSGRYQVPAGDVEFPFVPGGATHNYSAGTTTTTTVGNTSKDTYSVSIEVSSQASAAFFAKVSNNLSVSDKLTYTNQSSSTITSGTSQSMSFIVVPPAVGAYSGPTQIQVWKDNIYDTFMFFPEN